MPAASLGLLMLLLAGCAGNPETEAPVLGEAWAGAAVLNLREDIPLKSPVTVTVKHGERLEIVQRRRRFVRVRTEDGKEGWTEQNALLAKSEVEALRELAEHARKLRPHGTAVTFDLLNVHTLPSRPSPSFTQVNKGDKMEVLMHVVTPRAAAARPPLIPPPPKRPPSARKKKRAKETRYPPPPLPAPPRPPANWLEMSRTDLPPLPPEPPKPVLTDDWTLVRLPSGQVGWVLTRRLYMSIPDEVAQYAEGARITSYFSLGEVDAAGEKKHHWLWTTTGAGLENYQFDSFRVFIWNVRRNRYETAYIERRLKGYFPVEVHNVSLGSGGGTEGSASFPGFSVCVEKADGQRYRRSFAFIVNVVRFAGEGPCPAPPVVPTEPPPAAAPMLVAQAEQEKRPISEVPIYGRILGRIGETARRLFGKSAAHASEAR